MELLPVDLHLLDGLRSRQAEELRGPVQAWDEADLADSGALHIGLHLEGALRGYASYGPEDERGQRHLLEIFVEPGSRRHALPFLRNVLSWIPPGSWRVSSYDRFALSLALGAGFQLNRTNALLWSYDGEPGPPPALEYDFVPARTADLDRMRPVLREDDFYTADWSRLPAEIARGWWHLLLSPGGTLVGIGYYEPLARTPAYADVGMVVSGEWRGRGFGSSILRRLVRRCREQGLEPVATCAFTNEISRRTLQKAGFYAYGRVWSVMV